MEKRTQLNINIDEKLLKDLKQLALSKNMKLNALVKEILSEKTNSKNQIEQKFCDSDLKALNFTNFMKTLFQRTTIKLRYQSNEESFAALMKFIEPSNQWNNSLSLRLKSILLDSGEAWKAEELNKFTTSEEDKCILYEGLRNWTHSDEFPSQKLIFDLGSSLVPIFENSIKIC